MSIRVDMRGKWLSLALILLDGALLLYGFMFGGLLFIVVGLALAWGLGRIWKGKQ